jgi:hypothetical protein
MARCRISSGFLQLEHRLQIAILVYQVLDHLLAFEVLSVRSLNEDIPH